MEATTVIRLTKQQKLKRLGAALAMQIAREKKDPLLVKLMKAKMLWKKFKAQIIRKYGQRGLMLARRIASGQKPMAQPKKK